MFNASDIEASSLSKLIGGWYKMACSRHIITTCVDSSGTRKTLAGITGEGAQCDDLAEGNELIKSLQAKSAQSKDRYFQETLDKYNEHNFKGKLLTSVLRNR